MFQREDNDLHCEMPISFSVAALGGEIEIPTLDGSAKIKVPAETQSGKVFRLRGKGIKGVRSHAHGDLLCHVVVETPVNLTPRQKELLQELEAINREGRRPPRPARQVLDGPGEGVLSRAEARRQQPNCRGAAQRRLGADVPLQRAGCPDGLVLPGSPK